MDQKIVITDHFGIKQLFRAFSRNKRLAELQQRLGELEVQPSEESINNLVALYNDAIPVLEDELWSSNADESLLELYQLMFRQMEQLLSYQQHDLRHNFVIIIPVADRPQHLNSCLASLLTLCQLYQYGGFDGRSYLKLRVLIADDSQQPSNILKHREYVETFGKQGLIVEYFGLEEQQNLINQFSQQDRKALSHIIGDFEVDAYSHKGASIMRNITYLKLQTMSQQDDHLLFYFIDSDQEFRVKIQTPAAEKDVYAINYFYHIERIFSLTETTMLTGKVVGDPPVSPAVMAGNFLEDVITFFQQMSNLDAERECSFHNHVTNPVDDAGYHDMADLFGFKPALNSYQYSCSIKEKHGHAECFHDFSEKLSHFFDGEHPTRKTYYQHIDIHEHIKPARTVYTGNYVFNRKALCYFIPFATLKLRMAGPVLGRIIRAELQHQFVSANLPMLHKRTHGDIGQSEFRPGVKRAHEKIDLAEEFERQFFGDVMLFTIEKLTQSSFPEIDLAEDVITHCMQEVGRDLYQKYQAKHRQIMDKLNKLKAIFNNHKQWWNKLEKLDQARQNIDNFISNIEYNFGVQSEAYRSVLSEARREQRLAEIRQAIMAYKNDRAQWDRFVLDPG